MAPVPSNSPVTGQPVPPSYIHAHTLNFQDTAGRSLILRGVNLSGSTKAPIGQPSHSSHNFWSDAEERKLSFVGRPLDLDDGSAEVHLARLRAWGYNVLRFVFTWEAIEHKGPGIYDDEYLDYVVKVLKRCKEWGFRVYMDPHQDVWSRFTGGSGAPLWTLYACGIDPLNITPTYSSLLHSEYPSRANPKPHTLPQMIWATNYTRLACQTVFTLFFAGKTYAPKCIIDGVNIQDYLQDHFTDSVAALAKRIAKEPGLYDECVIGWDSMNEPGDGMIGKEDLRVIPKDQRLKKGPTPTPFDGFRLGMGEAVEVDDWDFTQMGPKLAGKKLLDPQGVRLWLKPEEEATRGGGKWGWKRGESWKLGTCIWAEHGVWDPKTSSMLKPYYFYALPTNPSHKVNFDADFWRPHFLSYASDIRLVHPEAILFFNHTVFNLPPALPASFLKSRACAAPHYYDGLTLMTKHWNWFNADALGILRGKYWNMLQGIRVGEAAIRKSLQDQLGILKSDTTNCVGQYPTLIGEIGCPFDMDDKAAYGYVDGGRGEGDYSLQRRAWDASMNAADGPNCLNYTLWTYVTDNSHEWGDLWDGEDLSIWSPDDVKPSETYTDEGSADTDKDRTSTVTSMSVSPVDNGSRLLASSTATSSSATLAARPSTFNTAYSPKSVLAGSGITPSLLLDGARAVAATCRPFPIATVGTPVLIDFDIASTRFTLKVKVSSQDAVPSGMSTEVYLPYVHYAQSLGGSSKTPYAASTANSSRVSLLANGSIPKPSDSTPPSPSLNGSAADPVVDLALDIEISVSAGSTDIQGQTLYWSYPVPGAGQADATYTLEVKRRGGALAREREELGGWVQKQGWGDVCPTLCSIM